MASLLTWASLRDRELGEWLPLHPRTHKRAADGDGVKNMHGVACVNPYAATESLAAMHATQPEGTARIAILSN